ncbi:MAG: hypothetical protein ACI9MR_001707 [Myxococcota bacterium]|jgi:hypothetical protein
MLRADQQARYARHVRLPEVGLAGQARILAARVRVAGTERAAEEAAIYLVAAGVGEVVLETALWQRIHPRLAALNSDAAVRDAAVTPANLLAPPHMVTPTTVDARSAGALAALVALTAIATGEPAQTWRIDPLPPFPHRGVNV